MEQQELEMMKNAVCDKVRETAEKEGKVGPTDKWYHVTLAGDRYVPLNRCACCMKETTQTEDVSASYTYLQGLSNVKRTIKMPVGMCEECKKHRADLTKSYWILDAITLAVALFLVLLTHFVGNLHFIGLRIALLQVPVLYIVMAAIRKLPDLGREHAAYGKCVKASAAERTGFKLTFASWEYAEAFKILNQGETAEESKRKLPKKNTMLHLTKYFWKHLGFAILGWYILAIISNLLFLSI